jgi:hypothetical protein
MTRVFTDPNRSDRSWSDPRESALRNYLTVVAYADVIKRVLKAEPK